MDVRIGLSMLKAKTAIYFTSKRWVYLGGKKENFNPGQTTCGKTVGKSWKQRKGTLFKEKSVSWKGCYKLNVCWSKLEVGSMVTFHWLNHGEGQMKAFLSLAGIIK